EGPLTAFERAAAGKRARPKDLEAYARYLVATGGDDPAIHRARNLIQAAVDAEPTVRRLLFLSELAEDRNQRARWIERAEKLGPKVPDVEVILAKAALSRESLNFREAFPLYEEVLRRDPDEVSALRGKVELYDEVGLKRTALNLLERAVDRNPRSVM